MPSSILENARADCYDDAAETSYGRSSHVFSKRFIDIVVCVTAFPAALLITGVSAIVILITMGRPIFFSQDRVGLNGRVFRMYKLRTMRSRNGRTDGQNATLVADPRVTPVGRFLRQTHIDEIPQLWNVFVSEMTLIGPRPEQPLLVEHYRATIPGYDRRHLVKPGLSGWAQVRYGYAADAAETSVKLRYDLHYLAHFGPWIDIKVAALTFKVFMNKRYVR